MSEKHNRNIFETFQASLVLLSTTLIKLHVTKLPVGYVFLINFDKNPLISNINEYKDNS